MGIQNYLKRISTATKDIKSAIEEKGVPVSQCDGFEQLADKVRAIQTGNGNSLFVMLAFKQSETTPAVPTGGYFSDENITYPTGWSDGAGLTENVWMSYCIVKGDGSVYKNWVQPIKISGTSSGTVDLSAYATKAWVTDQIAKISTGGDIDLSAYATKDYVQSEISKISTGGSEVTKSYVDTRDADTLKSAKSYADSLVQDSGVVSVNSMSGAITLKGSETVIIDRGEDGQSLVFTAKGGSTGGGNDGDTIRSFNIYINTDSNTEVPEIPTTVGKAPYWDYTSGDLKNIPTGWAADCTNDPTKYTWMSSAFFSKNSAGAMIGTWTTPLCITGEPGKPGEDGANFEFIYALTSDSDKKPNYPSASSDLKTLFDNAETNGSTTYNGQRWYDRAQSIDPTTNRACWMAQRVKYAGADDWSFYSSTPVLWANWGSDGTDGDGVEYIFFLTDDAHQTGGKWTSDAENFEISYTENGTVNGVSTPYANTVDDWVPKGWTDEPQDVSKTDGFYEFCAIRKSKDGVWQEFSTPALWAKFAMDGKDGASIEYVFARYTEELDPSKVSVDNDAANRDGAGTTDEYLPNFIFDGTTVKATDDPASVSEEYPYQWVSIRRKKAGESVWGDFSHPSLWNMWSKGSQGPKGEDGDNWEFVYALSEVADTPTVDTSTPATGSPTQNVSEDGFLPKFVFTAGSVDTVAEQPSVNETQKYCYQSKRRKHNGTWLSFSTPSMVANFVKAGITPDEIADIKKDVTNQLSTELNNAEKNVKALEERLSKIDGTDATFLVDNKKGIIQALTQYKSENQTSFSDLVLDGSEAKFKTMVGAEHDDILSGAGITMDGLAGTVKSFATYQEKTDDAVKRLNNAETRLNAAEATIENAVTSTTFEKTLKENNETVNQKITNMAKSTLDAAKAEINQTVATGVWIWAVWDKTADAEKAEDLNYTPVGDILATKPYDTRMFLTWTDSKGVKHTPGQNGEEGFAPTYDDDGNLLKTGEELYRESIEGTKWSEDETKYWTRTVEAKAFSRIIQQAGSIDLHAYGEEGSFARIFLDATKKGSEITLEADTVYFTEGSTINADNLVLRNISVTGNPENKTGDEVEYGAGIEYAQINNCKINSCEIASQIKSKTYVAHKDTENTEGKGFLIDSGAVAADGLEFAFYSEDGGRITNHEIITKKISSTNFSSEDGNKAGFSLDGSDKNNTFAFYGKTSTGEKFELTNDSLVIPTATITGKLTADQIDADFIDVINASAKQINAERVNVDDLVAKTVRTSENDGERVYIENNKLVAYSSKNTVNFNIDDTIQIGSTLDDDNKKLDISDTKTLVNRNFTPASGSTVISESQYNTVLGTLSSEQSNYRDRIQKYQLDISGLRCAIVASRSSYKTDGARVTHNVSVDIYATITSETDSSDTKEVLLVRGGYTIGGLSDGSINFLNFFERKKITVYSSYKITITAKVKHSATYTGSSTNTENIKVYLYKGCSITLNENHGVVVSDAVSIGEISERSHCFMGGSDYNGNRALLDVVSNGNGLSVRPNGVFLMDDYGDSRLFAPYVVDIRYNGGKISERDAYIISKRFDSGVPSYIMFSIDISDSETVYGMAMVESVRDFSWTTNNVNRIFFATCAIHNMAQANWSNETDYRANLFFSYNINVTATIDNMSETKDITVSKYLHTI